MRYDNTNQQIATMRRDLDLSALKEHQLAEAHDARVKELQAQLAAKQRRKQAILSQLAEAEAHQVTQAQRSRLVSSRTTPAPTGVDSVSKRVEREALKSGNGNGGWSRSGLSSRPSQSRRSTGPGAGAGTGLNGGIGIRPASLGQKFWDQAQYGLQLAEHEQQTAQLRHENAVLRNLLRSRQFSALGVDPNTGSANTKQGQVQLSGNLADLKFTGHSNSNSNHLSSTNGDNGNGGVNEDPRTSGLTGFNSRNAHRLPPSRPPLPGLNVKPNSPTIRKDHQPHPRDRGDRSGGGAGGGSSSARSYRPPSQPRPTSQPRLATRPRITHPVSARVGVNKSLSAEMKKKVKEIERERVRQMGTKNRGSYRRSRPRNEIKVTHDTDKVTFGTRLFKSANISIFGAPPPLEEENIRVFN